jgi:PPP family 3-phenylpropionic acid transporter
MTVEARAGRCAGATAHPRYGAAPGLLLPRFLLLYGALYAAYGVEGPFLSALLVERGLSPEGLGLVLAAGTAARLLSGPAVATLADRLGTPRAVLAGAVLATAVASCGYGLLGGFAPLLAVSLVVSVALAPVNPLADALAMRGAVDSQGDGLGRGGGFDYGLVRGAGSAAFIAGAALAGPAVAAWGLSVSVWLAVGLLGLAAVSVAALPRAAPGAGRGAAGGGTPGGPGVVAAAEPGAWRTLLALPLFRRLLLVSALVQGSHALYGGFATLHWQSAGIGVETIGLLWSVAVAAEVAVFLLFGRTLMARLGPAGLSALAALAGVLRWTVMACTDALAVQFLVQPLHGLTFAAQHLAVMRLLAEAVPERLSGTAFGLHASFGPGLGGMLLTLAAGPLYVELGAGGFWVMALLCAGAIPASFALGADVEAPPPRTTVTPPVPATAGG